MCGRAGVLEEETGKWSNVTYMPCTSENNFIPEIPDKRIDIVYLCYPNNPTGTTLTKPELKKWVDYALANDTLILFDAAYEAYIQDENVPHSIYEIKGAKKCAIEFRSFSKTAGFTGVRCGYTVVPKELTVKIIKKGLPIFFNEFLWAGGLAALTQCYSTRGLEIISGLNISNAICNLLNVVFVALGSAIGILIGQTLGASQYEKAKKDSQKKPSYTLWQNLVYYFRILRQFNSKVIYMVAVGIPFSVLAAFLSLSLIHI